MSRKNLRISAQTIIFQMINLKITQKFSRSADGTGEMSLGEVLQMRSISKKLHSRCYQINPLLRYLSYYAQVAESETYGERTRTVPADKRRTVLAEEVGL